MGRILSRLRHAATGRLDDVYLDPYDGAYRLTSMGLGERVYLDEYVAAGAEPPAAGADDGPREVLAPAGAQEGHGWSVGPTRTIGNVPEREPVGAATGGMIWVSIGGQDRPGVEVDDEARDYFDFCDRLEARARERREAPPSPGPCPTCGTQRRERGEVRVHVWRCGCPVRPVNCNWYPRACDPYSDKFGGPSERIWWAAGHGAKSAEHPTRDGAIAAWREALAEAQRAEDER